MKIKKINKMVWSEIINELPKMKTSVALQLFFENENLDNAQKGCLLYRIMSNERFATKEEFERFTGIDKQRIIYLMREAENEYNNFLLENKDELYNIRTVKERMKKLKDIPFEDLPRPFKKIDEFLELIPGMTADEIWREFRGNINLTKAEEGLCIYYIARLEKIKGLTRFIEVTDYSQNQIYTRLQHLKKVYGEQLIQQFLNTYHDMSIAELLTELHCNILLTRKENGLIYLQLMKKHRFELQKELIEKYGFNTVTVSVAIKEAKEYYKDLAFAVKR